MKNLMLLSATVLLLTSCANQKALRHEWHKKTRPAQYLKDSLKIKQANEKTKN